MTNDSNRTVRVRITKSTPYEKDVPRWYSNKIGMEFKVMSLPTGNYAILEKDNGFGNVILKSDCIVISDPTDKKTAADCLKEITEIAELEGLCPDGIWNEKALNILDGFLSLRIAELREEGAKELPDIEYESTALDSCDFGSSVQHWVSPQDCELALKKMKEAATTLLLAKEQHHKQEIQEKEGEIERLRKELEEAKNRFQDTEADGLVFCGKCGKLNSL